MLNDPWMTAVPRMEAVVYRPAVPGALSVARAAKHAHVRESSIYEWIRNGRLSKKFDGGGSILIDVHELDCLAQSKSKGGRPRGSASLPLTLGARSGRHGSGSLKLLSITGDIVRCKCACGTVLDLTAYQFRFRLRCGPTCLLKKRTRGGPKAGFSWVGNYNKLLRGNGRNRKIPVALTFAEYAEIRVAEVCFYCVGKISRYCIGLDRIDNALGYCASNVVACCGFCNVARGHLLSVSEFRAAMAVRRADLSPGAGAWDGYTWRGAVGTWRGEKEGSL